MEREAAVDWSLESLDTPCLVLDVDKVEANADAMTRALAPHGVPLRQHVKTAKSVDVARLVVGAEVAPITVSTLAEAEHFAAHGFVDQTLAVGATPARLSRIAALQRGGVRVRVIVDDADAARALVDAAAALGTTLEALIELDVGQHRGGVAPDGEGLLAIARALGGACVGVLAHAGQSYDARSRAEIARVAEEERSGAVHAAQRLRGDGHACGVVSVGSTPTALFGARFDGVTEVRAGVFVFQDLFQAALGCARVEDVALSVLTSVIGVHVDRAGGPVVLVDAGGLALSKDRSLDAIGGRGYGEVVGLDGVRMPGRPVIAWVNQEHGAIELGALSSTPRVGDKLRVLPNHACMTAAMYDRYHVVDARGPRATWRRLQGS